jgi:hypothetical protein
MEYSGETSPFPIERRHHERVKVMLLATLGRGSRETRVRLTNLSPGGSAIDGAIPDKYCSVTLHRNGVAIRSRVAWSDLGHGGVAFDEPLELTQMLTSVASPPIRYGVPCRRPGLVPCAPTRAERHSLERCINVLGIAIPKPGG